MHSDSQSADDPRLDSPFDARLAAAMHDVTAPADLAGRILALLQSQPAAPVEVPATSLAVAAAESTPAVASPLVELPQRTTSSRRRFASSRRRWIAGFASLAASLLVVGALSGYLPFGGSASHGEPALIVDGWSNNLSDTWKPVASAPRGFAVPAGVAAAPRGCQSLSRDVWAFRLAAPGSRKAMLFVARMAFSGLPTAPPLKPQSSTGGRSLGVWQSKGLVYFLVVDGDDNFYRTFIKSTSSPLA